jgi:hypothetical protein
MRCQAYIKRYLAMKWFKNIKYQNDNLSKVLNEINQSIGKYNIQANTFKNEFTKDGI